MIKQNKKGDIFQWLFASLVGAVIIFIALYGVYRYINIERYRYDIELAKSLDVLMNPFETSLLEAQALQVKMPSETEFSIECNYEGFGTQLIEMKTRSGVGKPWQGYSKPITINNKYIFTSKEKGKELYIFSKSLKLPFKLDLIYALLNEYCFVTQPSQASEHIQKELKLLNITKVNVVKNKKDCENNSIVVELDVSCEYNCEETLEGYVKKDDEKIRVKGAALLYGAAFSSPEDYYCNTRRIAYRIGMLAMLHAKKADELGANGCAMGEIKQKLFNLANKAFTLAKQEQPSLEELEPYIEEVENENDFLPCHVF